MRLLASTGLYQAITDKFADGREHGIDEVAATCGHLIPPEIAVRNAARDMSRTKMRSLPMAALVECGRLGVLREALWVMNADPRGTHNNRPTMNRFILQPRTAGPARGVTHASAKLNDDAVREIRQRIAMGDETHAAIAKEYGVNKTTVSSVCTRKTWRHVE